MTTWLLVVCVVGWRSRNFPTMFTRITFFPRWSQNIPRKKGRETPPLTFCCSVKLAHVDSMHTFYKKVPHTNRSIFRKHISARPENYSTSSKRRVKKTLAFHVSWMCSRTSRTSSESSIRVWHQNIHGQTPPSSRPMAEPCAGRHAEAEVVWGAPGRLGGVPWRPETSAMGVSKRPSAMGVGLIFMAFSTIKHHHFWGCPPWLWNPQMTVTKRALLSPKNGCRLVQK